MSTAPNTLVEIKILGPSDHHVLSSVEPEVFDEPVDGSLAREFLHDPRHHLAVAIAGDRVVGFASAVHYVHPDKPAELWINEVGVAPAYQRHGIARRLLDRLFRHGSTLGCAEAWVLTEPGNEPAIGLYGALGGEREQTVLFSFPLAEENGPGDL